MVLGRESWISVSCPSTIVTSAIESRGETRITQGSGSTGLGFRIGRMLSKEISVAVAGMKEAAACIARRGPEMTSLFFMNSTGLSRARQPAVTRKAHLLFPRPV